MPKPRPYHSLLVRENAASLWGIHFGDYVKATVKQERADIAESEEYAKRNSCVITTGDKQADIDSAVAALNAADAALTFPVMLEMIERAETRHKAACAAVSAIVGVGTGSMGLTPDHVKATREWRAARAEHDAAFAELRRVNGTAMRLFKKDMRAHHAAQRAAKLAARIVEPATA